MHNLENGGVLVQCGGRYICHIRFAASPDNANQLIGYIFHLTKKFYFYYIFYFSFHAFIVYFLRFSPFSRSQEGNDERNRRGGAHLEEVVEDAGTRYGSIATIDGTGASREFVTSRLSTEEVDRLTTCQPDGLKLFEYLRDQEAPQWVEDFPAHIRSLGLSPDLDLPGHADALPRRARGQLLFRG